MNDKEIKAYKHQWYLDNKQRLAAKQKVYTQEHKEEKKIYDVEYRLRNQERVRNNRKARRIRIKTDWIESQGGKCIWCESTERLEPDHIDPTTKHPDIGKDRQWHSIWRMPKYIIYIELSKCQLLCHSCHLDKTLANQENARGSQLGQARLSEEDIPVIRKLLQEGNSQYAVAAKYNVNQKTVWSIANNKTWNHVS